MTAQKDLADFALQGLLSIAVLLRISRCHCAKLFINHDVKIVINSTAANSVNKIPVLFIETQCLQGFFYDFRVKKDLAELLLQGLNLIFNFALWLINGFTH